MPKKSEYTKLSDERIKEITRKARNGERRDKYTWFDRGEIMSVLADAFSRKADHVELDGTVFKIKYSDKGKKANVSPEYGFTPCGFFDVNRYIKEWAYLAEQRQVTRIADKTSD